MPIPATLSKKVLKGLLREQLGYKGVIISDAFTMNAISEHFGEHQAVERAVATGVDIILRSNLGSVQPWFLPYSESMHRYTLDPHVSAAFNPRPPDNRSNPREQRALPIIQERP